jgi:predicted phosphodiesterase
VNSWEQNSVATGITTLFQVKAFLQRQIAIATEFPEIHPVRISTPALPTNKPKSTGLQGCLIIPDSQNGFRRNLKTGELDPIHDPKCWDLAIQLAQHTQPDTIVLLGDMVDLCEFGKYTYTPDMAFTTQATLDDLAQTLCKLVLAAPSAKIIYLEGNHELRLEKAICENLKAAYGLTQANASGTAYPVLSIPHLLGLSDLGIEYVGGYPDSIYWINEHLACVHGSTVKQGGGETTKALLRDKPYSVCQGHIHRAEYRALTSKNHTGLHTRYAFSPGTIARIDGAVPAHSKENDWQQGLSFVSYDENSFAVEMISIDKGQMFFRGQSFLSSDSRT